MDTKKLRTIKNYDYGRYSLLLFAVFSFINVFTIAFSGSYFVFSSYLNSIVIKVITDISTDYLLLAVFVSVVLIVPYVVCAIFARKHCAFMIAGLVFVVADTALLVAFSISSGSFADNLFDIVCHAIVIAELCFSVANLKAPQYVKEQKANKSQAPDSVTEEILPSGETVAVLKDNQTSPENEGFFDNLQRQITIQRKKSFYGCAAKLDVVIDGVTVATLKNGQAQTVVISGSAHSMYAHFAHGNSEVLQIPEGTYDKVYEFSLAMKMTAAEVKITEIQ